jgi:hypothetical protein
VRHLFCLERLCLSAGSVPRTLAIRAHGAQGGQCIADQPRNILQVSCKNLSLDPWFLPTLPKGRPLHVGPPCMLGKVPPPCAHHACTILLLDLLLDFSVDQWSPLRRTQMVSPGGHPRAHTQGVRHSNILKSVTPWLSHPYGACGCMRREKRYTAIHDLVLKNSQNLKFGTFLCFSVVVLV